MISFDFYGFRVGVSCEDGGVLEDVRRDFSYFACPPGIEDVNLEVISREFPRSGLPVLRATFHTPRNTVYRRGNVSYVDYAGRGLMIDRQGEHRYEIYCTDRDLGHEIAFLTILSRVGQHLDSVGLHRVHALGVEAGGQAVLVLLPMGGGKTTSALKVLGTEDIRLLSDDSPLISRSGEVFPFPLRIGVRVGEEPAGIEPRLCRTVRRMEFGPKTLIDIEHFKERIGGPSPIGAILLGERWLAGPSAIHPASRRSAAQAFIKNTVVGLGLYQGVEFVLERSAWELLGKAGLAYSRLRSSLAVIGRSEVYRFVSGPDVEQSSDVLIQFIREFSSRPAG